MVVRRPEHCDSQCCTSVYCIHNSLLTMQNSSRITTTTSTCLLTQCVLSSSCCGVLWCAVQIFDRPFLFFLVDETTQTVLFQGAVTDPSKSG